MRALADADRIHAFLRELGKSAQSDTTLYLAGGATAVLKGWRPTTIDVDLRLEPDSDELLRRLSELKNELDVNVELATPLDFLPELPEWRERSPFITREGKLDVHHLDYYAQALAKIERGHARDVEDVGSMLRDGLIERPRLLELFAEIEPLLHRFPAIDPAAFREKVERVAEGL